MQRFADRWFVGFALCAMKGKWGDQGDSHPPPRLSQSRMLTVTLWSPLKRKWFLRPVPPRHGLLYERSAFLNSATEELKKGNGAPARICTSNYGLRRTVCRLLHFGSFEKEMRHAGTAPARSVWKTGVLLLHQWRETNEMVAGPGIAPGSSAFQTAALTDSAIQRMVPPRGCAPWSAAYRAAALLLSYRGMVNRNGCPRR